MHITAQALAEHLAGQLDGDGSLALTGIAPIPRARATDVTFAETDKHCAAAAQSAAAVVIVPRDARVAGKTLIRVANPRAAFARTLALFVPARNYPAQIHPTAQVAGTAKLGRDVFIGEYAVVRDHVTIGDRTVVEAHCFIGESTTLGEDGRLYPGVKLYHRVRVGHRVIIHAGSVIGSDGFGYVRDGDEHVKVPQAGDVIIEDDVEIGANTTIDRATMDSTVIRRGTKIDNLVQIAHNVSVGELSLIVAQTGIAGSCQIGKNVTLAGQVGIADHIKIGDNTVVGAQAGVIADLPAGAVVWGTPAQPRLDELKQKAALRRLPELLRKLGMGKK
jgi:UDP-3-O-[3-hydroxymyristoyl] glucosamine N-acyltransferase